MNSGRGPSGTGWKEMATEIIQNSGSPQRGFAVTQFFCGLVYMPWWTTFIYFSTWHKTLDFTQCKWDNSCFTELIVTQFCINVLALQVSMYDETVDELYMKWREILWFFKYEYIKALIIWLHSALWENGKIQFQFYRWYSAMTQSHRLFFMCVSVFKVDACSHKKRNHHQKPEWGSWSHFVTFPSITQPNPGPNYRSRMGNLSSPGYLDNGRRLKSFSHLTTDSWAFGRFTMGQSGASHITRPPPFVVPPRGLLYWIWIREHAVRYL